MKLLLIVILIIGFSCKNQKGLTVVNENQDSELTLLVQDGFFFTDSIETSVVKDEKTLRAFFSRVNRTRRPGIPVPKVNFKEEMVLVVCMGEQETTAMPYLSIIETVDKEIIIGIKLESKEAEIKTIVSYPFCIYKTPISENKITFRIH